MTTDTEALVRRAYHLAKSNWAMWSSGWASCFPTFTGSCTRSTCSGTSSRCDPLDLDRVEGAHLHLRQHCLQRLIGPGNPRS
jgi:hypothetical protein